MALAQSSVVELCPAFPDRPALYFKEIFVSECFPIPTQKPDAEMIVNVDRTVELVDVQTVTVTLPGAPLIPQPNPGNKIFVAGNIYLGVQYSSTAPDQKVHFARFQLPFETIILDDCGYLIDPANPIFPDNYVVHVCIEKMLQRTLDDRTICFDLLLLIWVEEIA